MADARSAQTVQKFLSRSATRQLAITVVLYRNKLQTRPQKNGKVRIPQPILHTTSFIITATEIKIPLGLHTNLIPERPMLVRLHHQSNKSCSFIFHHHLRTISCVIVSPISRTFELGGYCNSQGNSHSDLETFNTLAQTG